MSWLTCAVRHETHMRFHVLPVGDLRDHEESDCWCKPASPEDDPSVIVHNALDGREAFETGERVPS